jgi:hypothetical protein
MSRDPAYPRARAEKLRRTHGTEDPDDVVHDTTGYAVCLRCDVEYNLAPGDRYSLVHRCEPATGYT